MATISQKEWKQYIARLRTINDTAAEEFRNIIIDKGGYGNIPRQKLIDYAYGIATKYGEASAALSAQMYDAVAELSKAAVPAALPAETASYSEVAQTVNGILKKSSNENMLSQGIGRLVKMAGTDTMLSNAYRDRHKGKGSKRKHTGAQVAWIPMGDTCPFCLMLASKGWMNQTEWGAKHHSEHIHANCDCTYAVRFNDNLNVEGYDPNYYKDLYDNAEGKTRDEKFNSMRRDYYDENKDKINAQKRAAYAEKTKMEYRHERDINNPITTITREGSISAKQIIGSPNGIYVSDALNIKPKKLQEIENNISLSKRIIGAEGKEDPRIIIVADTELGNAGGRYDAKTNTVYYKVIVDKKLQKHVNLHELYHWNDSQEFIQNGNTITKNQDIIDYMSVKGKEKLDKMGITADNVGEISDYAERMYHKKRFDEVYTELRTKKGLE